MFRKELIVLGCVAVAVFVVVAGIASLAVRTVQRDATMVAEDTLPSLVSAGEAIDRLSENWINAHLLLGVDSAAERTRLIHVIGTNSTAELWRSYGESIFDVRDARLFQQMESARMEFMAARTNYFEMVRAAQMTEARRFLAGPLSASFEKYHRTSSDIFVFNAEVGLQRADRIIQLSRWTPFVLGGLCVGILLVGVFIGFKASLGAFSHTAVDYARLRK